MLISVGAVVQCVVPSRVLTQLKDDIKGIISFWEALHIASCNVSQIPVLLFHELEEIIGSNIRGFRKRLRLTQEKLAEHANLHPTFVGDIERANVNMSIETLKKLAKALKVEPQILLIKGAFFDAEIYQKK